MRSSFAARRSVSPNRCSRTSSCSRCMSVLRALICWSGPPVPRPSSPPLAPVHHWIQSPIQSGSAWPISGVLLPAFQPRGVDPLGRSQLALLGRSGLDPLGRSHADLIGRSVTLSRQGLAFLKLGTTGVVWHTKRLSWDGFGQVVVTGHKLTALAWSPLSDSWESCSVDLTTGASSGGSFSDDDSEGWE